MCATVRADSVREGKYLYGKSEASWRSITAQDAGRPSTPSITVQDVGRPSRCSASKSRKDSLCHSRGKRSAATLAGKGMPMEATHNPKRRYTPVVSRLVAMMASMPLDGTLRLSLIEPRT